MTERIGWSIKAGVLAALLCILLTGCGSKETLQAESQAENLEVNRWEYAEETIALPGEVSVVSAMREVGGVLWLLTDQGLYQSEDEGDSWSKNESFTADCGYVAAISDDGAVAYRNDAGEIVLWKENEEEKELHTDFSDPCYKIGFLNSDRLLLGDTSSNIEVLDIQTDTVIGTLPAEGVYHYLMLPVQEKALVWDGDRVKLYGEELEEYEECELAQELFSQDLSQHSTGALGIVAADNDNAGFFYSGSRGIFHYTLGGSVTEQLMEGTGNTLGDDQYSLSQMAALSSGSFVISYIYSDGAYALRRYVYRKAGGEEKPEELTLYTLYENKMLRQEVNAILQENPGYSVAIEVGVTGENGITREDALKTLNTEILAGNGPDLILLDGMPVKSYIEKGMLADLSEVLEEVDKEEGLYRNITNVYEADGAVMAVPARFAMPLLVGKTEDIAEITDLETLVSQVEALKAQNPEMVSVIGLYDEALLEALFDICAPSWITDTTVNAAGIKTYLEAAGWIQRIQEESVSREDAGDLSMLWDLEFGYDDAEIDRPYMIINGYQSLAMYLSRSFNFSETLALLNQTDGLDFSCAKGQSGNVFLPLEVIGLNSGSENSEQAKDFVRAFLSSGSQSQFVIEDCGYPVNRTALITWMEDSLSEESIAAWRENDDTSDVSEETFRPGLEKIAALFENLDTAAITDETILDIVLEKGMEYLNGETELEEAADGIVQSLLLRLSE